MNDQHWSLRNWSWFLNCNVLIIILFLLQKAFGWLVGDMEIRPMELSVQRQQENVKEVWNSAVHIKKCRYLEATSCKAMCTSIWYILLFLFTKFSPHDKSHDTLMTSKYNMPVYNKWLPERCSHICHLVYEVSKSPRWPNLIVHFLGGLWLFRIRQKNQNISSQIWDKSQASSSQTHYSQA